jgi:hypothetical protein
MRNIKKKRSYYLKIQFVRGLSGFEFWRLSIYHKSRMIKTIGYYDIMNNFLFVNFGELFHYMSHGLSLSKLYDHNYGTYLKGYNLSSMIVLAMYYFISQNVGVSFLMPKRFWIKKNRRYLRILYYGLFHNLISYSNIKNKNKIEVDSSRISKIIWKRLLILKRINVIL